MLRQAFGPDAADRLAIVEEPVVAHRRPTGRAPHRGGLVVFLDGAYHEQDGELVWKALERLRTSDVGAKSGAPVVARLEKRLVELDDRVAKITMDLVSLEEQRPVARRQLHDDVGGLSLDGLAATSGTGAAKGSASP